MPTTKIMHILWLADEVRRSTQTRLWLTTSGDIISGRPATSTEYYQLLFGAPTSGSAPVLEQDLLALRDVEIMHGTSQHTFNAILVDLNLVVAWGAYYELPGSPPPNPDPTK